jgi:hypothetical protein
MTSFSYEQLFERNLGVFTQAEQDTIRSLTGAVAGAGGVGGGLAYALARLGVGAIRIADPEVFEPSNVNRQFGAYVDTVGRNKAEVVAEDLLRINPELELTVLTGGIDEANIDEFVTGADFVVDEIDFFPLDADALLHRHAVAAGVPVFLGLVAGSVASFMWFDPQGPTFEELFCDEDGVPSMGLLLPALFPIMPVELEGNEGLLDAALAGQSAAIPSWSHAPLVTDLFLLEDIVRLCVKGDPAIGPAPDMYAVDTHNRRFVSRIGGEIVADR